MTVENETFARSLVSLDAYELMIENYRGRSLSEQGQLWFETIVRQRELKRREVRR